MLDSVRSHVLSHPLLLLGVCYLAVRAAAARSAPHPPESVAGIVDGNVRAALAVFVLFVAVVAVNVAIPAYADHVEPSVAALSWAVTQGQPLYPSAEAPVAYGLPYGPILFVGNGLLMKLAGPSIPASKLLGALASAASLILIAVAARRTSVGWARPLLWTTSAYFAFGAAAFWVRAEPLLLFCSSLAALSVSLPAVAGAVAAAVALGIGVNLKISAALYLLPVAAILGVRHGARTAAVIAGIAATVAALPFAFETISASGYLYWIQTTAGHGFRWRALPSILEWALFVTLPLPLFARRLRRDLRWLSWLLAMAVLASSPLAAKHGTGPYHFLPFVPLVLWTTAAATDRGSARMRAFLAASLVLGALQLPYWVRSVTELPAAEILSELRRIERATAGSIAMGYSENYRLSFFRPELVFRGHPNVIDGASAMDAAWSGRPLPEALIASLSACDVDHWLIPAGGSPFELPNAYGDAQPVFSEVFRQVFFAQYRRRASGEWFDVWRCER